MNRRQLRVLAVVLPAFLLSVGCNQSLEELTGAIAPVPENGVVEGDDFHYYLVFPKGWYVRNFGTDPEFDREFIRPDNGAEVLVVGVREEEGTAYSLNAFMRYMTDEADKIYEEFRIIERYNLSAKEAVGRLWHASGKLEGEPWHIYCAFYVRYNMAFAIIAGAPTETFPHVKSELEQIIESFELQALRG